jgi:hypothetical protein
MHRGRCACRINAYVVRILRRDTELAEGQRCRSADTGRDSCQGVPEAHRGDIQEASDILSPQKARTRPSLTQAAVQRRCNSIGREHTGYGPETPNHYEHIAPLEAGHYAGFVGSRFGYDHYLEIERSLRIDFSVADDLHVIARKDLRERSGL